MRLQNLIHILILAATSVSLALGDDFKTYNGKEYKNAIVTQVDPAGIVVRTKTGISKLYFTELPEDVRKRYNYDPGKAAAYAVQEAAAQQAAAQQAEESIKQQKEQQKLQAGTAANQQNIQALQNAYQDLLQQEQDLLVAIGQAKNAREDARRKWITRPWGQNEPQAYQYQTDAAEANLPLLEGRLENVRDEKKRVREELARAQRVSLWSTGKSSLTISAKLDGVWAGFQPSIPTGERSGLQTHIAATGSVSLCTRMKS